MRKHYLLCPAPASTPATVDSSRAHSRGLPPDLLKEAARRLQIMSLLGAVLWIVATALYQLATQGNGGHDAGVATTNTVAIASALISLALFFYSRRENADPRHILDLGLVYMVLTSAAIGLTFHIDPVLTSRPVAPMITWAGVAVLMFAAIVPNHPRRTLVAGVISAAMNPLGMIIVKAQGQWDYGPPSSLLIMHYPDLLLVGVAVVVSHVVTRLGQQVTRAREMGSYQLVSQLGKGGMGEVWRASHRMLARDAAIKLIQPDMLTRDLGKNADVLRRRFEQEAKTTASLRSPHTVQLYDFGVSDNGSFYYVMELLDGVDLETLIKRFGPLPPSRVVHILRQVCLSLAEANRYGMVHRDIKPTNIFLCRMGTEYDFAKVLDFGLVKMIEDHDVTQMTAPGGTTGTPSYMPPELALGGSEIDGRTDLYGLGCVAYWLLTGGLVFEEKGSTAMILAHVRNTPIPPSQRSGLPIPESLERIVLMCLEKERDRRPASADALVRMLDDSGVEQWSARDAELWWRANMPEEGPRTAEGSVHDLAELSADPTI